MWKIECEETGKIIARCDSEEKAKEFASQKWPGCEFDGSTEFGARSIYIYDSEMENKIGEIVPTA